MAAVMKRGLVQMQVRVTPELRELLIARNRRPVQGRPSVNRAVVWQALGEYLLRRGVAEAEVRRAVRGLRLE